MPKSEVSCSAPKCLWASISYHAVETHVLLVSPEWGSISAGTLKKELHSGLVCEQVPWLSCINSSMLHACAKASCWLSSKYKLIQGNLLHCERQRYCFLTLASEHTQALLQSYTCRLPMKSCLLFSFPWTAAANCGFFPSKPLASQRAISKLTC